jgi:hypothetical protein
MIERRAPAAAVAVLALVCAGCFGDEEKPDPTPAGEVSVGTPMTIYTPKADQRLKATTSLQDSLRTTLTATGRVEADARVVVNSGCAVARCARTVRAKIDGRWEARVQVMVSRSTPFTTIVAINADDPTDRASVDVTLYGKKPPPEKKQPKKKRAAKKKPKPGATQTVTPAPTPTPAPPRNVILIGDSLGEGMERYLPGLLPGWSVQGDSKTSRPLATGMRILATTPINAPTVLAFSLFTNDSPRNVAALESAVRTSLQRAGPNGCAVWATIRRPPYKGVGYAAANRLLKQLAAQNPRLRVVPWAETTRANPSWLGRDGVHATSIGYQARAQMYADAARSCGA